jgi:hypothetical protein
MSIAAGVNAHALCSYMGHSGIQVTLDLYGHLFPGNEAEASALLDAYLDRALTEAVWDACTRRVSRVDIEDGWMRVCCDAEGCMERGETRGP